jgi:hypothetical protein
LETGIYYKPTTKHEFLRTDSTHPVSLKNSLIRSLGLIVRLNRIISNRQKLLYRLKQMGKVFEKRGYKRELVQRTIREPFYLKNQRNKIITPKIDRIIFPITYHPNYEGHLNKILKEFWEILIQ